MSDDDSTGRQTRRAILAALIGGVGWLGWLVSTVSAQVTPAGQISNASDPAETIYVEKVHMVPRTSDPSSPDDGTMWYNEDA